MGDHTPAGLSHPSKITPARLRDPGFSNMHSAPSSAHTRWPLIATLALLSALVTTHSVWAKPSNPAKNSQRSIRRIRAELNRIKRERLKARTIVKGSQRVTFRRGDKRTPVLAYRRQVLPLTLEQAIILALKNDLGGVIAKENARASEAAVPIARAAFDPTFSASAFRSRTRRTSIFQNPLTGLPAAAVTNQNDRWEFSTQLQQLTPWGATTRLSLNQTRSETLGATNNPQIDVNMTLAYTQPLLRNFGFDVTLANLRNSRLDKADAYASLASTLQGIVLSVRQAYWAVVSAEENLRVQQTNLSNAVEFFRNEEKKFELGSGRKLEVAVAEATVARRREAVIQAETDLENSRDALLNRIAPNTDLIEWDVFIVPLDRPSFVKAPSLNLPKAVNRAFLRRLDLKIAARDIIRNRRNLVVADNNTMPNLDFVISGSLLATGEKHHNAYKLLDPPEDAFNLRLGFNLSLPLFLRSEKAQAARARHNLRAAEFSFEKTKADAILEVRRAIRAIISARERVLVNQTSVKLNERQLETEIESVRSGISVARDLLDAQQQLANARLALQRALIDYREAIASYDGSLGILLDKYRPYLPASAKNALDALVEDVDEDPDEDD